MISNKIYIRKNKAAMFNTIDFHNNDIKFALHDKKPIRKWITQVIVDHEKEVGEIVFVFCTDEYLLNVNKEFLKHDYYTDIITFDYSKPRIISGEIYISIPRVRENAKTYKVQFVDELHRVIIHGILHLLGYKDKSRAQEKEMRKAEDKCLALFKKLN